ncbi:hypothetical protein BCR39DRAFT_600992 [Naematelia encephala]|uniref:Uncharacterized protein n=1 Tax=Naematelia encephala TaxID=71784 RepID=A0A1Y2AJT8_9TREE|nr:hypothetical protein BCR39DRAFT_600992 [Naematelia encephala]
MNDSTTASPTQIIASTQSQVPADNACLTVIPYTPPAFGFATNDTSISNPRTSHSMVSSVSPTVTDSNVFIQPEETHRSSSALDGWGEIVSVFGTRLTAMEVRPSGFVFDRNWTQSIESLRTNIMAQQTALPSDNTDGHWQAENLLINLEVLHEILSLSIMSIRNIANSSWITAASQTEGPEISRSNPSLQSVRETESVWQLKLGKSFQPLRMSTRRLDSPVTGWIIGTQ